MPVYTSNFTDLELDNFVYAKEKTHFLALMDDPFLKVLIDSTRGSLPTINADASLAKNALKLDLRFSPTMKYAVERCQSVLKLKANLQVYVISSPEFNAFCMSNNVQGDDGIRIGVTSALLEKFSPAELAFVMGHEIGHALYNHAAIPTSAVLTSGVEGLTALHVMRLLAWKRAAEVTADRIGLLCGESFEKSARALFKVSYGFNIHEDEALHHYLSELQDIDKLMAANLGPEDFQSTHPFGPVRLVALQAFAQSAPFAQHVGKSDSKFDRAELEKRVDQIVSVFESSYLDAPGGLKADMSDFLFWSGVIVAGCDGYIDPEEISTLGEILGRTVENTEIVAAIESGPVIAWGNAERLGKNLASTLFPREGMMLIRDLCMIALSDGEIHEAEFQVLVKLAGYFRLPPVFVGDVLKGSVTGLD